MGLKFIIITLSAIKSFTINLMPIDMVLKQFLTKILFSF